MCGGSLELGANGIATCEYCGTKQTIPKSTDENLQNLFNRANTLRIKSEFDKAEKLYERIVQADSTQAEAYWGLILCKYGIEYVDDPVTFAKIPTCHRASYDSIIADDDYKTALQYADAEQRVIYESQAKEIDRIQKEILALAQNEESYDVFICYKETDTDGKRTQDSVIANDIYYQLTQEGFKVFYAAITLEGKLGSAYEPIIFAALNSAKVMLAIGTKPEYFNAVWVKNEWSRFLKIIKKDRSKLLIPCYRDMDAYELPDEFAHLQAQDMSKIGFINDIVRGIKKVLGATAPSQQTTSYSASAQTISNISPMLERIEMFIEDGEFKRADAACETILNQDPKNAEVYLYKLMIEMGIKKRSLLANCDNFEKSNNYQRIIRFGDETLKREINSYLEEIIKRDNDATKTPAYEEAVKLFECYSDNFFGESLRVEMIKKAANKMRSLGNYKDAPQKAEQYAKIAAELENKKSSGGCYVATCVYGSYDCPEVWTLRRFRDDTLGATWYGRAFIRVYYAISPTLVKWFGHTIWFKNMWRGVLNKMVGDLNSRGVENTPYDDKKW